MINKVSKRLLCPPKDTDHTGVHSSPFKTVLSTHNIQSFPYI